MPRSLLIGSGIISLILYLFLAYETERSDQWQLTTLFIGLSVIYTWLIFNRNKIGIAWVIYFAIGFRIILLFSTPKLSDDYYRFIWDGRLIHKGINPYSITPSKYKKSSSLADYDQDLYHKLNSPDYHSVYPPVLQGIFFIATWGHQNKRVSIIILRLLIIVAEIGTLLLILRLLGILNLARSNLLLYALNPLVIIELTGNLHFEALMIFFMMLTFYWVLRSKLISGFLSYGLGIAVKLNPLIFFPLFLRKYGLIKGFGYGFVCGIVVLILFIPFIEKEAALGIFKSLTLYYQKFEFNGSIYYLLRELGYNLKDYNMIETIGKLLMVSAFLLISLYSFKQKSFNLVSFLWVYLIYILLSTTVHPWYITPMIAFCLFSNYRFPLIWSILVFFTYLGYSTTGFIENLWIVAAEYFIVFCFITWELLNNKQYRYA